MELSGSARTPRFPYISTIFECHTISRIYPSKIVWAHCARAYHRELGRAWHLTPHDNHHSGRNMRTCHTHFGEPLGIALGWWDDRKSNHKPVVLPYLPSLGYFQPSQPCALSCLRLSGHNFLVQKMRHNRNRRPYELRICDKCDWHSVQDEEHILLTVRMNTLLTFAHSTTSCSSHLNMKIAQIVWGLFWTNQTFMVWPLLWLSA